MAHILVVEDSQVIAEMLQVLLELNGHTVQIVAHNFQNLVRPDSTYWHDIDTLITDIALNHPSVDGCDILLYAMDHYPHVKRIVLSAAGTAYDVPYNLSELADVVLDKPSCIDEILRLL